MGIDSAMCYCISGWNKVDRIFNGCLSDIAGLEVEQFDASDYFFLEFRIVQIAGNNATGAYAAIRFDCDFKYHLAL